MGELVDATWVSTVAGATGLAVDDNLSIETNWCGFLVGALVEDVESVSNGRGGSLCPA